MPLTPDIVEQLPATLIDGAVNNIVPPGPGWMFVSTWHNGQPGSLDGDHSGPRVPAPEYSAVWAWAAHRDTYPTGVNDLTPPQLRDLVAARIAGWAPALRHLIAATDPATVAPVRLRTMPTLRPWQPSTVTLIGDAIHNMTPMAGIGANTALRDADHLRQQLLASGSPDLTTRVGAYEHHMRDHANRALSLSTKNAQNAAVTARLPRLAFRTVLRIAEALPPVKRKLFGPTPTTDRAI